MHDEFDDELQEMYDDPKRRHKALSNEVLRLPVKSLRLQEAITVSPQSTVAEAVDKMQVHREGCVLLVESKKLTGIFTERDLLYRVIGKISDLAAAKVTDYSTASPESMKVDDTIGHALNLMHVGGYRHIPIVDDNGEPTGVISIKDAIAFLSEFFPEDVLNLPARPLRTTREREGA